MASERMMQAIGTLERAVGRLEQDVARLVAAPPPSSPSSGEPDMDVDGARAALRSQYALLVLMVAYTLGGLWLLSQE